MTDAKMTPPATSAAPTISTPTSNMTLNVSNSTAPPAITPTSNVTITTTATMTHPHSAPTQQALTHPSVPPSPIPQVQVIQQAPIHTPAYLQQLYNPQQQLLMSGNITLQPTAMSPSIQAFSAPVLGLPLLSKAAGLEPKHSPTMKPVLMPSTTVPAASISTAARPGPILAPSSIMTTNRQVITARKTCVPNQITPQMLAASKSLLQGQSNYIPSTTNQTLVIGQLGVLSSQPSLIPAHTKPGDAQKMKPFVMGQATTLQPKSPILPHPQAGATVTGAAATATATVLNTSQFKQMQQGAATAQIVSTPQLITSQAAMIASQAQIINPLQALGPIPQGITWATPGGMQSSALLTTTQNPIFIRGQQQDMFLHSPPPQAPPAIQPAPTGIQIPKPKQVRPASSVATQTNVSTSLVQTAQASGLRPQVKHRNKSQVNRSSPGPGGAVHQKADAANQTKIPVTPPQQSTASQTKIQTDVKTAPVQKANVETQVSSPIPSKPPSTNSSNKPDEEEPMDTTPEPSEEKEMEIVPSPSSTKEAEPKIDSIIELPIVETTAVVTTTSTVSLTTATTTTITTTTTTTTATNSTEIIKEKQPQKAIVKPHVLTHVIDGYVIQEGPEPFPVNKSSLMTDFVPPKPPQVEKEIEENEESPSQIGDYISDPLPQPQQEVQPDLWKEGGKPTIIIKGLGKKKEKSEAELAKCEFCGKVDAKRKFKRSKRFCSTSCAKRYNVGCSKRIGLFSPSPPEIITKNKKHGMKSRKGWRKSPSSRPPTVNTDEWQMEESSPKEETTDSHSGAESSLSPTTPTSQKDMEVDHPDPEPEPQSAPEPTLSKNPLKWSVQDVYSFIKGLPGCSDYADEFRLQEIDGQALLLLKEDHLMTAMSMKLGPALKICARINVLKDEVSRH